MRQSRDANEKQPTKTGWLASRQAAKLESYQAIKLDGWQADRLSWTKYL